MKRCPYVRAIWHSHSLAAALRRPRLPPQPPVCPRSQQGLDLASSTGRLKCFLQSKAVPDLFFFKEPLVFPLLEEARALCLATNRLPTSRCAQSIHPHSSKRKGLGREQAAWSPPTPFTQLNEQPLNRTVFSCAAVEAMLWPVTHQTRGELRIYDKRLLSPLCFSLWHHTA